MSTTSQPIVFARSLDGFVDSRTQGYQGPTRSVRLYKVTPVGGGAISVSEDGTRCAVAGKESLRIIRISTSTQSHNPGHKSAVGRGGHKIDASRNFWDGSGLKIDSASTGVAWGQGIFSNKILTSARNGELIMWDLNKSGSTKLERRSKDHSRSINTVKVSPLAPHYCVTGSADGDLRMWDLRDISQSVMRVSTSAAVRSLVLSPLTWQPMLAIAGLDNGTIFKWEVSMSQRGLATIALAHTGPVTTLDWYAPQTASLASNSNSSNTGGPETFTGGMGWLASGGLDRTAKVWDLTSIPKVSRMPQKPAYVLRPSFPIRRILWRPSYECELAIVSNSDFATESLTEPAEQNAGSAPGLLSRVGSGLESMLKIVDADTQHKKQTAEPKPPFIPWGGDAIEIWDVRRPWIAKWSVTGSSLEGGVTDMVFADSHAVLAQHSSGMFSQIDIRGTTKPSDAIPRVAVTWEAAGSLVFVADRKDKYEVPYDDRKLDQRAPTERRRPAPKSLGDAPARPMTQTIGKFSADLSENFDMFTKLAERYTVEGHNRQAICATNAQVALECGHDQAVQVWLLLGVLLTDYKPDLPPTSPQAPRVKAKLSLTATTPHVAGPASGVGSYFGTYAFPPNLNSVASGSFISQRKSPIRVPLSLDQASRVLLGSPSSSRKKTPASSTSSSPRHITGPLPPITPRRGSFFTRRPSVDSSISSNLQLYRRASVSSSLQHNPSPSEKGTPSLRHVGEGALDDSDSDSVEGQHDNTEISDGEAEPLLIASPLLAAAKAIALPSPLSRVAGQQQWTEDEDENNKDSEDEASPSPRSTDTESGRSDSPPRRTNSKSSRSSRRNSFRVKSRSRSSTVASLAAPALSKSLVHHDSLSSIRTVTAAEGSTRDYDHQSTGIKGEETIRDIRASHSRQKSQLISEIMPDHQNHNTLDPKSPMENRAERQNLTERNADIVYSDENIFRDLGWDALRESLEEFADEGDVQMCAILSIVAPQELRLSSKRVVRFLDAYLELLTRLQLYTSAAYLRKYCRIQELGNMTLVDTIIYTSCGKCRKPLLKPASAYSFSNNGTFSYCHSCQATCVKCSVCRLPVKALLFQCSVCGHGGHQACYQSYYMTHPMVNLSQVANNARGRTTGRHRTQSSLDEGSVSSVTSLSTEPTSEVQPFPAIRSLAGHPCAAGCGHYCWATNGNLP